MTVLKIVMMNMLTQYYQKQFVVTLVTIINQLELHKKYVLIVNVQVVLIIS